MPAGRTVTIEGDEVVIDLTEPKPGTLGHRLRLVEDDHDPEYGTLGYRLSMVGALDRQRTAADTN